MTSPMTAALTGSLLALSTFGDVILGYLVTAVVLTTVAWRVVARGRALAAQVPDEDKPWT
jgi:hypothetical protein